MTSTSTSPDHLFLREGTTYVRIPLTKIHFIEADGNYAYLQTEDKRYTVKRSLSTIAEELQSPVFVRSARGILVNFSLVDKVSFAEGKIYLGNREVKLGKAYHADVKRRMPRL